MPPFRLVDTTLREGEQFATSEFTPSDRVYIAKMLDKIGVDYIEMVNPAASTQAVRDCEAVARLGLRSRVLTHTRCHMHDVAIAVATGVQGVNLYMATSAVLREHSHGKGIDAVIATAAEVIGYVQKHGLEVRFSCEDAFRSNLDDILRVYAAVDKLGVDRVGVADTVGVATPFQVYETVRAVRSVIRPTTGIEFHTHNDTGCCVSNALMALEAGATHIDTSVLGIGERNGITPLGGFLARMYTIDKEAVMNKYNLSLLRSVEKFVAVVADVQVPFNNYVTGSCAFTHKAGVHSKAVMSNPTAYEVIDPADFGVERRIQFAHRLTGWNAMAYRAKQLGLNISDDQIKAATTKIKNLADQQSITMEQVDTVLTRLAAHPATHSSTFLTLTAHHNASSGTLEVAAHKVAEALKAFEAAAATAAVDAIAPAAGQDLRPSVAVKFVGHLFDKALMNRLLDLAVDSLCEFKVETMNVPKQNELHSTAVLRLWGRDETQLVLLLQSFEKLVDGNATIAECTMEIIEQENVKGILLPGRASSEAAS